MFPLKTFNLSIAANGYIVTINDPTERPMSPYNFSELVDAVKSVRHDPLVHGHKEEPAAAPCNTYVFVELDKALAFIKYESER